jgi:glycosyltransferase involved in cell wall biosynthesis
VRQHFPKVIVVDDGSTDATLSLAKSTGAMVASHDRNIGKGAALKTGLTLALGRGFEWAFTLDGDGQHNPDDMPSFLRCAEQTGARLIIGNRMQNSQAMPWLRRQVNRWMSRMISRYAAMNLPDTQCGFRLIHLGTWATLALATAHFEVESETLLAFLMAGHRVEFVPIAVIGDQRASRIAAVVDSVRWLKWWCALRPRN